MMRDDLVVRIWADTRFDVASRLLWLLTWLTRGEGYIEIAQAELARQLTTDVPEIQAALRQIIDAGFFYKKVSKIMYQPNQYLRIYKVEESKEEFRRRLLNNTFTIDPYTDNFLSQEVRLHWMVCDQLKDKDRAEISHPEGSAKSLKQTLRQIEQFGYFRGTILEDDHDWPTLWVVEATSNLDLKEPWPEGILAGRF